MGTLLVRTVWIDGQGAKFTARTGKDWGVSSVTPASFGRLMRVCYQREVNPLIGSDGTLIMYAGSYIDGRLLTRTPRYKLAVQQRG